MQDASPPLISSHEIARKFIHLSSLIYPLLYLFILDRDQMLWLTGGIFVVLFLSELLRRWSKTFARVYMRLFGFSLRSHEAQRPVGATYFLLGVILCIALFEARIAIMALCVLVISDTCASLIGLRFGRVRLVSGKSLEGTIAFVVSASLIALLGGMVFHLPLMPLLLAAGISGMFELFSKPLGVDDNILVPLGFAASATFWLSPQ